MMYTNTPTKIFQRFCQKVEGPSFHQMRVQIVQLVLYLFSIFHDPRQEFIARYRLCYEFLVIDAKGMQCPEGRILRTLLPTRDVSSVHYNVFK